MCAYNIMNLNAVRIQNMKLILFDIRQINVCVCSVFNCKVSQQLHSTREQMIIMELKIGCNSVVIYITTLAPKTV
jgi:hypothetical protein